ncbi:uncharacterized protein [Watersipora subatra]|uniref:uncharacterized protein n=1 Tax=Watersipora subatra TaxID=2589382 RepID=UPI00355B19A6
MATTFGVVIGVCITVAVAIIILVTQSFSDVHYYEFGFVKSKVTGTVDTSKVWTGGRFWIGPGKTFKVFDSIGQVISLPAATVFAAPDELANGAAAGELGTAVGASLVITISVEIVYFLVEEDLTLLHDEYDVSYHDLMTSSAQAALKDTASKFTLQQFYRDREVVEAELLLGVRKRLGGMCCPINCSAKGTCFDGCIERSSCTKSEKGLFVEARYLQLTDLVIPETIEARNLKTLILTEETAKETFTQQAAVIEKETEQLVEEIVNQAKEVTANSTAQAQLIAARSNADYVQTIEAARKTGLVNLFTSVGLSTVDYKNSFDYLRSLADNSNAHLTVDFDQLITGPTKLP